MPILTILVRQLSIRSLNYPNKGLHTCGIDKFEKNEPYALFYQLL